MTPDEHRLSFLSTFSTGGVFSGKVVLAAHAYVLHAPPGRLEVSLPGSRPFATLVVSGVAGEASAIEIEQPGGSRLWDEFVRDMGY